MIDVKKLSEILHLDIILIDNEPYANYIHEGYIDSLIQIGDSGITNLYKSFAKRYPEKTYREFLQHSINIVNDGLDENPIKVNFKNRVIKMLIRKHKLNRIKKRIDDKRPI